MQATFLLGLGVVVVASSQEPIQVADGSTWCKYPIAMTPANQLAHLLHHFLLHEVEHWCHFICVAVRDKQMTLRYFKVFMETYTLVFAAVAIITPQRPAVSTPDHKGLNILGWAGRERYGTQ